MKRTAERPRPQSWPLLPQHTVVLGAKIVHSTAHSPSSRRSAAASWATFLHDAEPMPVDDWSVMKRELLDTLHDPSA